MSREPSLGHALICWDQEGPDEKWDTAVIAWRYGHETPVSALNEVLALFYNQGLHPFFYLVWQDDARQAGMLVTDAAGTEFEPDEMQSIYRRVIELIDVNPQEGTPYEAHEVPI